MLPQIQIQSRFLAVLHVLVVSVLAAFFVVACKPTPSESGAHTVVSAQDYHSARYDPIHFKPAIEKATDAQCLSCHQEVLKPSVSATSKAGLEASKAKAWYQDVSTYQGEQDTFHRRHLATAMAKQLMTMRCTTCHEGNDPREEAPGGSATPTDHQILRKMVNPETVCLKCHGKMNWPVMGLPEPWEKSKTLFQNNCLTCHASIRTHRHQVNYLNAQAIETAGAQNGEVCFGCHGGRAWYRTHYPYPRHPWPGMASEVPDWAKDRPSESELRFLSGVLQSGVKP